MSAWDLLEDVAMDTAMHRRMSEERSDLNRRVVRLKSFIGTADFFALDSRSQDLLSAQRVAMEQYLAILDQRLELSLLGSA